MSTLHEIVNGLPSGPEHAALQMLVEVNDVHHHEVSSLTARIHTLERNVAAMSTPEAVANRDAASALDGAVDIDCGSCYLVHLSTAFCHTHR
jgi:hypothetical protein